ncbi:MFS transporter [Haloarculaceae archaeon H-GB11]|nr:MFS transporter [Haloarculaceae archaeon H-GB11]
MFLGRGVLPPLLPTLVDSLSITLSSAGVGLSVLWVSYAVAHYPGGRFADHLTRKTPLVASVGAILCGFVLLVTVPTYPTFLLGVTLVGLGHGLYWPSSRGLIADLFVRRRSQALGIQVSAAAAGNALSAGVVVAALSVATWQASFVPTLLGLACIGFLLHRWNRESYSVSKVELDVVPTVRRLFTTRRMLVLMGSYCLFVFAWLGVMNFLPSFLHAEKDFSLTVASSAYALFYGVGIVVSPLAGNLGDRLPRLPLASGMLLVTAAGAVVFLLAESFAIVVVGVVLFAAGIWAFPPVMQASMLASFPDESMASDFGALKTVYTAVGATGPAYVGIVAQRFGYTVAYAPFGACLVVSAVGLLVVHRIDRA